LGQRGPGGAFEPRVLLSANYLDRRRVALIDNQSAVAADRRRRDAHSTILGINNPLIPEKSGDDGQRHQALEAATNPPGPGAPHLLLGRKQADLKQ
jgi:hypothetical protein